MHHMPAPLWPACSCQDRNRRLHHDTHQISSNGGAQPRAMHITYMNLHHRSTYRRYAIGYSKRGMGICTGVKHYTGGHTEPIFLKTVYDIALMIALKVMQFMLGITLAQFIQKPFEIPVSINSRLPHSKKIEVGTI